MYYQPPTSAQASPQARPGISHSMVGSVPSELTTATLTETGEGEEGFYDRVKVSLQTDEWKSMVDQILQELGPLIPPLPKGSKPTGGTRIGKCISLWHQAGPRSPETPSGRYPEETEFYCSLQVPSKERLQWLSKLKTNMLIKEIIKGSDLIRMSKEWLPMTQRMVGARYN
jgi:hypothetical protein